MARKHGAARVVLAVPVCAPDVLRTLRREVDELICLEAPTWFCAVGQAYTDFRQTTDGEVVTLLRAASRPLPVDVQDPSGRPGAVDEEIEVPAGECAHWTR
jgi:putative phosphoribosyl transferase